MNIPLSLYIHWPFCKAKCPYCDFNSHVREGVDHVRWKAALLRELTYWAEKLSDREVVSIFFGGGTPSLMQADTVQALIDASARHWKMAEHVEITLEANPTSIETGRFREFAQAGVNRVSIGIQALNQDDLIFLGRQHTVNEALAALDVARTIFSRHTFDLIYARPGQSLSSWERELKQALHYADRHLSLYQLTIEENTAFHTTYHKGAFIMPEEGLAADMYMLTQDIMEAQSLPAYEISNHAVPGEESRHNLAYWKSDDYVGIGPGAHGRVSLPSVRYATETVKSPERWLEKVEQSGTGLTSEISLSPRERGEEMVMMGLRLKNGIDYADWQARTGIDVRNAVSTEALMQLKEQEFIIANENHIKATRSGALLLNRITAALLK